MKEIKSVGIVGMGALGLLFANIIQENLEGFEVSFVMDEERFRKYQKENFTINNRPVSFKMKSSAEAGVCNLVIVAVKGTGLDSSIETIRKITGNDTIIISVLNGITSESVLEQHFGREKIISTVAQGMDAMRFGSKLNYTKAGALHIGTAKGESSENLETLVAFFEKAGVPYKLEENIMRRMWSKFMLNVGINQTCMSFDATYSKVLNDKELFETFTGSMKEVISIANAEGIDLNEKDLQQYVDIIKTLAPEGTPSMGQDRINKKKSEVELFSGTVIKIAQKHGIQVPVNQMLYDRILEIEKTY
ncbi:MAG: ketopantoate reductase family protein [Treponema sp.]|nr:ketopantoate reductase family protein [Candidatus Treponema equifaecale]